MSFILYLKRSFFSLCVCFCFSWCQSSCTGLLVFASEFSLSICSRMSFYINVFLHSDSCVCLFLSLSFSLTVCPSCICLWVSLFFSPSSLLLTLSFLLSHSLPSQSRVVSHNETMFSEEIMTKRTFSHHKWNEDLLDLKCVGDGDDGGGGGEKRQGMPVTATPFVTINIISVCSRLHLEIWPDRRTLFAFACQMAESWESWVHSLRISRNHVAEGHDLQARFFEMSRFSSLEKRGWMVFRLWP